MQIKKNQIVCFLIVATTGFVSGNFLTSSQTQVPTTPIARYTVNGCATFCNGSPINNYNISCIGAMNADCKDDDMFIYTTCIGTYDLVIAADLKVSMTCDGLYFNNIKGTTPTGETIKEGADCGGQISLDYYVASKDNILPSTPGNTTCKGTFVAAAVETTPTLTTPTPTTTSTLTNTPTPILTPTPAATPTPRKLVGDTSRGFTPTPTPTPGKLVRDTSRGFTPTPTPTPTPRKLVGDTVRGLGSIEDAPPGHNCTYMCGSEQYNGMVCHGDYEMSCDIKEKDKSSTMKYDCTGIFAGQWDNMACIGYGKLIQKGIDYVYTEICTKQTAYKAEDDTSAEVVCEGEFSAKTIIFSDFEKYNT